MLHASMTDAMVKINRARYEQKRLSNTKISTVKSEVSEIVTVKWPVSKNVKKPIHIA